MAEEERFLYFAFGSNLLEKQRIERLSKFGDLPRAERAVLNDYEISFHKIASLKPGDEPHGYATIHPSQNQTVHGLLIGLNHQQISRLDKSEGVNATPPHYTKEEIIVQTDDGVLHSGFTYIASPMRVDSSLHPATWYLQKVVQGARETGLDEWYVEKLESFGD
jgi:gamma-glutamylcyclotransferase